MRGITRAMEPLGRTACVTPIQDMRLPHRRRERLRYPCVPPPHALGTRPVVRRPRGVPDFLRCRLEARSYDCGGLVSTLHRDVGNTYDHGHPLHQGLPGPVRRLPSLRVGRVRTIHRIDIERCMRTPGKICFKIPRRYAAAAGAIPESSASVRDGCAPTPGPLAGRERTAFPSPHPG